MTLYRTILKKAWDITIKHKMLWIFGLFASIFNNYEIVKLIGKEKGANFALNTIYTFWENVNIETLTERPLFSVLAFLGILILFSIAALLIWIAVNSQITMIQSIRGIYHNQKPTFKKTYKDAQKQFWPILELNIGAKIAIILTTLLINLPIWLQLFFNNVSFGIVTNILYIALFILSYILSTVIYFIVLYGIILFVTSKQSLTNALKNAYYLFKTHWLTSIEMVLILVACTVIVSILSNILNIILLPLVLTATQLNIGILRITLSILLILTVVGINAVLIGWLSAFQLTNWILLYESLEKNNFLSKVKRLAQKLNPKLLLKLK